MSVYFQERFGKYFEASLLGAGRGLIALPLEHPLDVIKTRSQATLEIKSVWEITRRIYASGGMRGFYSGAIPNGARLAVKQMYRYPMMLAFPSFFKESLPAEFQRTHPDVVPITTALSIASFETFFVCPLERCKVFLMTSDTKEKLLREFFRLNKGHLRIELFRGIGAVYARQISSWASFLVSDKRVKEWEKNRTQTKQLSFNSLMLTSGIVGLINTAANMPFDVAKTALQKREHLSSDGLWKALKSIYQQHGLLGIYAGWKPRMLQYMLQSAFTVTLLDRLERSWK